MAQSTATSAADQEARPPYAPVREARFAVVLYGGVSLAIYMNGVVQELFSLVRATAPDSNGTALELADEKLTGSERVYRELGRRLQGAGPGDWVGGPIPEADPVRTRFVIDIISGTSAGGINGIFLAKAIANGQEIDFLRTLWIDEGEIGRLFNRRKTFRTPPPSGSFVSPPAALLAGPRLLTVARQTLMRMGTERQADAPRYAEQVDLRVTATDLQGLPLPIELADHPVIELEHRLALRFNYATERATGGRVNDFVDNDDLLAFAARATSSFPFAFEPVLLTDLDAIAPGASERIVAREPRFFDHAWYDVPFQSYPFADGGYLDNKPFSHATEALRRRRADVPVDRKLIYIEPHPKDVPPGAGLDPAPRPDAIGNVGAALIKLPRTETIRDDIVALHERNRAIEHARAITRDVELAALRDWSTIEGALGPTYLRLRRLELIEALADAALRAAVAPPQGPAAETATRLFDLYLPSDEDVRPLLADLDLGFRLRRVAALHDRINELLEGGPAAAELLSATGAEIGADAVAAEAGGWLRDRKQELADVQIDVRKAGRLARARGGASSLELADAARRLGLEDPRLQAAVRVKTPEPGSVPPAPEALDAIGRAETFIVAIARLVGPGLKHADYRIREVLSIQGTNLEAAVSSLLLQYNERWDLVDEVQLPLTYPDLGDANPVEVYRVSPEDAPSLMDSRPNGRSRLAGVQYGNFGAFLSESWRRSDLLWGRLDGAERILAVLVPDEDQRQPLRVRAQAEILREELLADSEGLLAGLLTKAGRQRLPAVLETSTDAELLDFFRLNYESWDPAPLTRKLGLAGRGLAISVDVLAAAVKARPLLLIGLLLALAIVILAGIQVFG